MMHLSKKDLLTLSFRWCLHCQSLSRKKNTANLCLFTGSQALLKKHKETSNNEESGRSGRPRTLSAADEKHIKLISLQNRKMNWSSWKSCSQNAKPPTQKRGHRQTKAFWLPAFFKRASSNTSLLWNIRLGEALLAESNYLVSCCCAHSLYTSAPNLCSIVCCTPTCAFALHAIVTPQQTQLSTLLHFHNTFSHLALSFAVL